MKTIIAVIRPHRADAVKNAVKDAGSQGMILSEVRGFGRQKGRRELYRGKEYEIEFQPKTRIEMVVPNDHADEVISSVIEAARTGEVGDGKIFVLATENAHRVRTGETGVDAL